MMVCKAKLLRSDIDSGLFMEYGTICKVYISIFKFKFPNYQYIFYLTVGRNNVTYQYLDFDELSREWEITDVCIDGVIDMEFLKEYRNMKIDKILK